MKKEEAKNRAITYRSFPDPGANTIRIRGARENNLKDLSVDIPRNRLVVLTGISGSGKTSLAFDTIYAEGQRRYMQSLSSYARQFLGQMDKPDVDSIDGLSPAISIDQKSTNHNPRSTVGTVTEIYDYLRLLYARIGIPHCPRCGREIRRQSVDEMVDQILSLPEESRISILAPVVRGKKGQHAKLLEQARKSGYVRARVDGSLYELSEPIELDKNIKHTIEIVVDRLILRGSIRNRLADSVETALALTDGLLSVDVRDGETLNFSQSFSCPDCEISIDEIEPRSFSFNNPFGACPVCYGLGNKMEFDLDLIIPDRSLSINEGAIDVLGWRSSGKEDSYSHALLEGMAEYYGFDLDTPYQDYPEKVRNLIEYGVHGERFPVRYTGERGDNTWNVTFEGLLKNLERRYRETGNAEFKTEYETYMRVIPCESCRGRRLKPSSLSVTVGGMDIYSLTELQMPQALAFIDGLDLSSMHRMIADPILKEIRTRLGFLINVGLDYLTLSRAAGTLSGGESQRIRLATQIGSGLVGVTYILDEPSIGLHQRDNGKLLATLRTLRDLENSVLVVEHDEETMREADWIVDIGPGAGGSGGEVVAQGTAEDIMAAEHSITGDYLAGRKKIPVPETRKLPSGFLRIRGASENNLKDLTVEIPLGVFCCVTGVSGSGKSTLVNEILYKEMARRLYRARVVPGKHQRIEGTELIDKVIQIDQSPIGRTPRSNPATYTGAFDLIRELFAATTEARARGYSKGRFSFNVRGGRCEACSGDGILKIEMNFLPDVYVPCEVCGGKRYNRETLEVHYRGKTIYDVLEMTVEEALDFFSAVPPLKRKLEMLHYVGLSYVKLGQPSTELSGGEAQRVKLATELCRRPTGRTMYILDEPTTGLHFEDVSKLVRILQRLADGGNSVVVIEHNMDVIKCADYLIDMGPEGGDGGGTVVAAGTPEEVARNPVSYTGQYVRKYLE